MACQDQRLRAGTAFGQAQIDEQLVGAHLGHHRTKSVSVATLSNCGSIRASRPGAYQR